MTNKTTQLAINRTDIPDAIRLAVMEAMHANGEFARADERGDEAAQVYVRKAQIAEGRLCDLIAEALQSVAT